MPFLSRAVNRVTNAISRRLSWQPRVTPFSGLARLGTRYGGWTIPMGLLNENSACYLVGAGEDLSFDTAIVEKFRCHVFIFDPTPRARTHFNLLMNATEQKKRMPINNSDTEFYTLQKEHLALLHFSDVGLWGKTDDLKFYAPRNPDHVSHSVLNLQNTESFFVARVERLSKLMLERHHGSLDLLKLDVEGAEYVVLDSIIEDRLNIKAICVEYDEAINPLDDRYLSRIKKSVKKILSYGYNIVDVDAFHNYTFLRKDILEELSGLNPQSRAVSNNI